MPDTSQISDEMIRRMESELAGVHIGVCNAVDVIRSMYPLIEAEVQDRTARQLHPFLEMVAGWFDDIATAAVPPEVGHLAAVRAGQIRARADLLESS